MDGPMIEFVPCTCSMVPTEKISQSAGKYITFNISVTAETNEKGSIRTVRQNYSLICFRDNPCYERIMDMKIHKGDYLKVHASLYTKSETMSDGTKRDRTWYRVEKVSYLLSKADQEVLRQLASVNRVEDEVKPPVAEGLSKFRN